MRTINFEHYGQTYHLRLTSAALYDIYDRFGAQESAFDHILGGDRESFEAVCWYLHKLAEQGELTRRWQGFEAQPIPTEEQFRIQLQPKDMPRAKLALLQAMNLGFGREIKEDGPVDEGLAEFQKKTPPEKKEAGHALSRWLRRFLTFLLEKVKS